MTAVEVARFEPTKQTDIYEDDFEKELDAFIEKEETAETNELDNKLLDNGNGDDFEKKLDEELGDMEKGQLETSDNNNKEKIASDTVTDIQTKDVVIHQSDNSSSSEKENLTSELEGKTGQKQSGDESGKTSPSQGEDPFDDNSQSGEFWREFGRPDRQRTDTGNVKTNADGGQSDISTDNEEDRDYDFTEDQIRAMNELEKLKALLDYTEDDPPEYDVRDRIKKLNEELASEPMPEENERKHKVGFKENLVDLVVPPPDYEDEEPTKDPDGIVKKTNNDSPPDSASDDKSENITSGNDSNSEGEKKHKVLIEREGRFELVSADDVHAIDLGLSVVEDGEGVESKPQPDNINNSSSIRAAEKDIRRPQPPTSPRPATASSGGRRNVRQAHQPRPRSALIVNHGSGLEEFNYTSPYALSPDQKRKGREQSEERKERERAEEERKKKEDKEKVKENDEAFDAWLRKKRETAARDRANRCKEGKSEGDQRQDFFKEWLETKREQKKKDKLLKQREQQEQMSGKTIRNQRECDKAFREWLRRKNRETFTNKLIERQKARVYHLSARRSRKSQALARALRQAQSFKYLDYYGYRF